MDASMTSLNHSQQTQPLVQNVEMQSQLSYQMIQNNMLLREKDFIIHQYKEKEKRIEEEKKKLEEEKRQAELEYKTKL